MLLTDYHPPSNGPASELVPTDCLLLRFDQRCRSRFSSVTTTQQEPVNVLLPRGHVIRHGGLLTNVEGDCIEVIAADETLLRVSAQDPHALLRAAYHLGNRHVKLEVRPTYLQLEVDPVLKEMLVRLEGIRVEVVEAIFEPEVGAYGGGHHHGHDETFAEDYASAQAAYKHHHGSS
jgi:urease accessory protein